MTKLDSTFVEEAVVEMEQSKTEAAYETDSRSIHVQVDPDAGLSVDEREQIERKLVRKLDVKLIPWLCLLYLVSFVDRTNIGNAKILGLQKDLSLTNDQWSASLCIFFVSYAIFEPASNLLLKSMRPSLYIPLITVLWGIVCVCQGLAHNFAGFATARWFLGLFEAGLFPGINFYLSCWYRRRELGVRAAVFFSAAAIAGSFGGLLAAAIGKMDGVGGKPGWAWIFILEGLATVIIGVASIWMVHDFPDQATFLSSDDRLRVLRRLKEDRQASADPETFSWKHVTASLTDWKTYTSSLIYMGCGGGLYAFSLFLPTIIAELGYHTTTAQLLSVPPYAVAALVTILVGVIGDRTGQRGINAIVTSLFGVAGFIMLLASTSPTVKLAATYLAAIGIYPCIPNTITWVANNTEGVYKRGVTLGIAMGCANLQGVVISNVYRAQDAPRFIPGHAVVVGYLSVGLFGGSVLHYVLLRRENWKKMKRDGEGWAAMVEGTREKATTGDKRPDFIYTL